MERAAAAALQTDRQSRTGQPARDARRRLAGHVERVAEWRPVYPMPLGRRVVKILPDRQGRDRHHRRQQQIVLLMECGHLLAESGADEVGAEIIDRADPLSFVRRRYQTGVDERSLISRVDAEELGCTHRPQYEQRLARRRKDRIDLLDDRAKGLE